MRAIQLMTLDGPDSVQPVNVPDPVPAEGQLLVEVHAAGVTFPEVLQTRGLYQLRPPLPYVPGSEIAGIVRSAPDGSGFRPGDRVAALTMFGGYAELAVTDPSMTFAIPDDLDLAEAAALPVNYLTVHFALTQRGVLLAGETVLVHGAAGGVGTAGIQLARALGAVVVAVASTPDKAELARACGAEHVVAADGFRDSVREVVGGVDVVLDPVGGDRFTDSLRCLRGGGRLLVVGFAGGEIPTVKVNRLLLNNTSVVGVAWGEYLMARPGYATRQWAELAPLIEAGTLRPPVGHRYGLQDAGAALGLMERREAVGRVVLSLR